MLSVTVGYTAILYNDLSMQVWVKNNLWLYYVSLVVVIAVSCGMVCLYKKCRQVPLNYILLTIYTIFHAYMVGALCSQYNPESLLAAFVCTAGMFFALTVYACFTKTDITYMGGLLSTGTIMLILFFIMMSWFTRRNSVVYLILICCGIVLMSIWIVYDTQLIVGGKKNRFA